MLFKNELIELGFREEQDGLIKRLSYCYLEIVANSTLCNNKDALLITLRINKNFPLYRDISGDRHLPVFNFQRFVQDKKELAFLYELCGNGEVNWSGIPYSMVGVLDTWRFDGGVIIGNVYGHLSYKPGMRIHTSEVFEFSRSKGTVKTSNSIYLLSDAH